MIQEKLERILNEALTRYGAEYGVEPNKIGILCGLHAGGVYFQVMADMQAKKFITVTELMNKKIDFTGMAAMIPHFISQKLTGLSEELAIAPEDIKGIIMRRTDGAYVVQVYNKTKWVKKLDMDEIIGGV